ncbi:MAG: hypothetical protein K2H60_04475, partial [Muribaculaceae bacterium]|nr:hypothetical protein [Muribaculaceae bacterium]
MKKILPYAFVGMLSISLPTMLHAGNIPQYKFSYENAEEFVHLENPTIVKSTFAKKALLFPDGKEYNDYAHTGPGFPIGFTFRLGGQDFTQFAIDNLGAIYLGTEEDGIVFRGQNSMMFAKNLPRELDLADEFYLGMIIGGVLQEFRSADKTLGELKPQVGYSLLGEEGNRVLVVEYRNMAPEGEKAGKAAHYDLQLRLYEADNHFEIAFNEVVSPEKNYMFRTGVRGFEIEDGILLTSRTLGQAPKISSYRYGDWDVPNGEGAWTIHWDGVDDYDNYYKPVYSFYPETDPTAPKEAPVDLEVVQEEDSAFISVKRASDADATVVLYSESPFTDADFPEDGTTFRSQGKFGDFVTTIGNATVLYYGNTEDIRLELPGIENSKDYYFVAVSANGYPAFNKTNVASALLSTSQAAPSRLTAQATGANSVKLMCEADDPVIIAVSHTGDPLQNIPYLGQFGRPEADAKVGDELPGGGEVIYVGDPGEFNWEEAPANIINYFAAWTVKEGRVSALLTPTHVCALPSMPYNAYLENFPTYIVPDILDTKTSVNAEILSVYNRLGDNVRALHVSLAPGSPIEFYLPELDLSDGDAELKFDYSLETFRGYKESDGGVPISEGNEPGHFDSGALEVMVNDGTGAKVMKTIKEYGGGMESNGLGGYVSATSTFEPVTVDLSSVKSKAQVGFKAETGILSDMYIKDIKLTRKGEASVEAISPESLGMIKGGYGEITVTSPISETINVYSIDGRLAAT